MFTKLHTERPHSLRQSNEFGSRGTIHNFVNIRICLYTEMCRDVEKGKRQTKSFDLRVSQLSRNLVAENTNASPWLFRHLDQVSFLFLLLLLIYYLLSIFPKRRIFRWCNKMDKDVNRVSRRALTVEHRRRVCRFLSVPLLNCFSSLLLRSPRLGPSSPSMCAVQETRRRRYLPRSRIYYNSVQNKHADFIFKIFQDSSNFFRHIKLVFTHEISRIPTARLSSLWLSSRFLLVFLANFSPRVSNYFSRCISSTRFASLGVVKNIADVIFPEIKNSKVIPIRIV